jgi:predicted HicB family RNase H-like nuclease
LIPLFLKIYRLSLGYQKLLASAIGLCRHRSQATENCSGKMVFRVSPEVHARALAIGKSLNQWAEDVLNKAAHV